MYRLTTTATASALGHKLPPYSGDDARPRPASRRSRHWRVPVPALLMLATIMVAVATDPKIPAASGD